MCGRTRLSLCAADVQRACSYKRCHDGTGADEIPEWAEEYNFGKEFSPSHNIAPTEITPVIVSAANFGAGDSDERMIKPMMWGMVPPWHRGSYKKHGLSTNNCRLEGIKSSKLFGGALREGNRCVIVAEGFYEWQTANSSKQPYYIYHPEIDNSGSPLLRMAGVYSSWSEDAEQPGSLYSYSIITQDSGKGCLDWLHHRMPAILRTDQEVADWLDTERVGLSRAVSLLGPGGDLRWHPVSSLVNSSSHKSPACSRPVQLRATHGNMDSWLRTTPDKTDIRY